METTETRFTKANKKLIKQLEEVKYKGDISDIGNEIGFVIGKFFSKSIDGWEKEDFMAGLFHGISLADGTHDEEPEPKTKTKKKK